MGVEGGSPGVSVSVEEVARDLHAEHPVLLVDFGSTYTKLTLVEATRGILLARASHRTTGESDVLDGFGRAREALDAEFPLLKVDEVVACSSAGGGLRLAVIGLEEDLTGEAGRRAALSAGARVVSVLSGSLVGDDFNDLLSERPDIVLLTGGTDGGNRDAIVANATLLAACDPMIPVVVAGNADARDEVCRILERSGREVVVAPNVMPVVGTIQEGPVRELVRELFVRHVIGGKHLSARTDFASMVRMPTPEAVLLSTELMARGCGDVSGIGNVAVADIGGATTDIHSVVEAGLANDAGYTKAIMPSPALSRTVEGDLGLRWNAPGIVAAAREDRTFPPGDIERLVVGAQRRADEPGLVPSTDAEADEDAELASIAARVALRRHAGELRVTLSPDGAALRRTGKDLRSVETVIGAGGVFVHATPERLATILADALIGAPDSNALVPRRPRVLVDRCHVMAAAGLLSIDYPEAAACLLRDQVSQIHAVREEARAHARR